MCINSNVTINKNTSYYGGAIFNGVDVQTTLDNAYLGNIKIAGATISSNTAYFGGAVFNSGYYIDKGEDTYVLNTKFIVESGSFTNNTAKHNTTYYIGGEGGVVYNEGELTINGGSFTGNTCEEFGGVIYNYSGREKTDSFNDAKCFGVVLITGGTFGGTQTGEGNTAEYMGGAVYNGSQFSKSAALTISGGSFVGNAAAPNGEGSGGAIANDENATMLISGGTISDNTAMGGAGIVNLADLTITGGTITNNTASL